MFNPPNVHSTAVGQSAGGEAVPKCRRTILASMLMASFVVGGCATSQRPVLYHNAHFKTVGQPTAERDIDACISRADQAGAAGNPGSDLARQTATGAAVGGGECWSME